MLPVQTVMIRYMVLVYRWGRGWLGAVGARGCFAGGAVTGGGALAEGTRGGALGMGAKRPRRRGAGGAFLGVSLIQLVFLLVWARVKVQGRTAHNPQE